MRTTILFIIAFVFSLISISCEKEDFTPNGKDTVDRQFDEFHPYLRETTEFAETCTQSIQPTCGVWALEKPTTGEAEALDPIPKEGMTGPSYYILREADPQLSSKRGAWDNDF